MPNYHDSKIYKLGDNKTGYYIGYTTQPLGRRLSEHKYGMKRHQKGNYGYKASYDILQKKPKAELMLIESYPCKNKKQLLKREKHWIQKYGSKCINQRNKSK